MTDKIAQIEALLNDQPGDAFLTHALALEYRKIGDFEKSAQFFESNLSMHKEYLGTYHAYGQLLEQFKYFDKAIDIYTQGLDIARSQNDMKTFRELQAAIDWIDD